eukprot:363801-Chlamydomonas_euryale.AAC.14
MRAQDNAVFNFFPGGVPAPSLDALVARYRELTPYVKLAGPTSFAPAIYEGMRIVAASGNQYHILVIVADGQVTRGSDMPHNMLSAQEQATVRAIVAARCGHGRSYVGSYGEWRWAARFGWVLRGSVSWKLS